MKHLNKKNNFIAWRDILLRISYHILFISLSSVFFSKGMLVISILFSIPHFLVYSFLGLAGLSHELYHNSVFSKVQLNQFFFKSFCIITWNNYAFFHQTHWKHHLKTLTHEDPKSLFNGQITYFKILELLTFDITGFLNKINYTVKNALNIFPESLGNSIFKEGSKERIEVVKTARLLLLFHLISLLLCVYFEMIHFFILINLGSFFITFFNKILGFAQHYGLSNKKEVNNYYINCRTIILPKFWSFFYSNMNYHVEHHKYPAVPYYNLKSVHSELIRTQNFPNLSFGWLGLIKDMSKSGMFSFCNLGKKKNEK